METGVCELMLTLEPFRCLDAAKGRLGRAECVCQGLSPTRSFSPESTRKFSPTWISSPWVNTRFCLLLSPLSIHLTAFLSFAICWRGLLDWLFAHTWQGHVSPLLSIRARSKDWTISNQVYREESLQGMAWVNISCNCQMRVTQGARVDTRQ